jgi:hypothetical protein
MIFIKYLGYISDINNGFDIFIKINETYNDYEFIENHKNNLWFSIEDIKYLHNISNLRYIEENNICLLPENNKDLILNNYNGICSKYINYYKQMFNAKKRYGFIINGRLNCYQDDLIPHIIKYLNENQDQWIDIHINLNDKNEKIELYNNLKYIDYPFIATIYCNEYITNDYMQNHPKKYHDIQMNISSMYYTLMKVFYQLEYYSKNNNILYDLIIKFRSDLVFDNLPNLNSFDKNKNIIYIPNYCKSSINPHINQINDQVAFGNYKLMKKYCMVYSNIELYLKDKYNYYHPETLLAYHIHYNKINIKEINFLYHLDSNRHKKNVLDYN